MTSAPGYDWNVRKVQGSLATRDIRKFSLKRALVIIFIITRTDPSIRNPFDPLNGDKTIQSTFEASSIFTRFMFNIDNI